MSSTTASPTLLSHLPNEILHLILESLWTTISSHPARDHLAVPPNPGYYYQSLLLASKQFYSLSLPFYVRWWTRGEPDRILHLIREKRVGGQVRHLTMRAWGDVPGLDPPLREQLWIDMFHEVTQLQSLTVRVDRLGLHGQGSTEWIEVILRVLGNVPLDQRRRIRKLNLQFASDVVVVKDEVLHRFAEILPNVSSLLLQGFGPQTEHGDVSIIKSGKLVEGEEPWWQGLRYVSLLHLQTHAEQGEQAFATGLLQASAGTLRSIVIEEFVQRTPGTEAAPLSAILGPLPYPHLNSLLLSHPPLTKGQAPHFLLLPSLTDLTINVGSLPPPRAAQAVGPELLDCLPSGLRFLTLGLESFEGEQGWGEALMRWVEERSASGGEGGAGGALEYLAVDGWEPPSPPVPMLMGFMPLPVPLALGSEPLGLSELQEVADVCERRGVRFASADERLWGGSEEEYELPIGEAVEGSDDGSDSEGSGAEEEEEEGEDFDAEDDAIWAGRWSEAKRREQAVVNLCEALKLDLKPDVRFEDLQQAVAPFLKSLPSSSNL